MSSNLSKKYKTKKKVRFLFLFNVVKNVFDKPKMFDDAKLHGCFILWHIDGFPIACRHAYVDSLKQIMILSKAEEYYMSCSQQEALERFKRLCETGRICKLK